MPALLIGLLVLWLIVTVVGFLVKTLFWLVIVGVVLFAATALVGVLRSRQH